MNNEDRERERKRRIKENTDHVNRHNAKIIPDTPGYVRINGPRRQVRGSVDSQGYITWHEI